MEILQALLHIDKSLALLVSNYGLLAYGILFAIIFAETGLVFAPFLPGDSLIFAVGALAGIRAMDLWLVYGLLLVAAVLGDTVNYSVGRWFGEKILSSKLPFIKKAYLQKTRQFFDHHGSKTIVLARFVPIVRTFAPFMAGIGRMRYDKFLFYNFFGGLVWVSLFFWGGYFFGNLDFVKENFTLVVLFIIFLSVLPAISEYLKKRP